MLDFLDQWAQHPLGAVAILAAGIVLLLAGGHWLVEGSVSIARRAGVSTLVIGLTLVAFGTSSPELAFNVIAAGAGHSELSFGNVVGSNIANIGLILGASALYVPLVVHSRVVSKELPLLLVVSVVMVVMAIAPPGAGEGAPGFHRFDGLVLAVMFAMFVAGWYRLGRRETVDPLVHGLGLEAGTEAPHPTPAAIRLVLLGLVGLVGGGKLAQSGAVGFALWLGLSEAVIGLTIVAVATSLPELAACIMACRKGHHDLAVGNVVGSNLLNIMLVLGATSIVAPVPMPPAGLWDMIFMTAMTIVLLPMALTHFRKITRVEGAALIAAYAGYMTWSVLREFRG